MPGPLELRIHLQDVIVWLAVHLAVELGTPEPRGLHLGKLLQHNRLLLFPKCDLIISLGILEIALWSL